ncbi:hypothetical protein NRF20_42365 [Streptomyces sp. R-74717]|uniref:hypothetical protein n=1 Tax=Streptomyces TaxID=1883 RepID=UPI0037AF7B3D
MVGDHDAIGPASGRPVGVRRVEDALENERQPGVLAQPGLPADQKTEIEEAAQILRKARAADGHTLLPLTVINRDQGAS